MCPIQNYHYAGFLLNNNKGENDYEDVTVEECQILCQKTHGCMFFNYNNKSKTCWLKWGVGIKQESKYQDSTEQFGPKNCPSKSNISKRKACKDSKQDNI